MVAQINTSLKGIPTDKPLIIMHKGAVMSKPVTLSNCAQIISQMGEFKWMLEADMKTHTMENTDG